MTLQGLGLSKDLVSSQTQNDLLALPVVVVEDDETTVTASEGDLVALVVPPVGVGLAIDHITEGCHVPSRREAIRLSCCNSYC